MTEAKEAQGSRAMETTDYQTYDQEDSKTANIY